MKFILIFCFVLVVQPSWSQTSNAIEYSDKGPFNWSMFKGKVKPEHLTSFGGHTAAVTVSTISYTSELRNYQAKINITALFNPQESWTLYPHLEHPEEALNHEKRHFQICEIYARKFRKMVSVTRFNQKNFHPEIEYIFKKITEDYRAEQNRYDQETKHSLDAHQQAIWNAHIDKELKNLSAYNKSDLSITLN